jgi:hypothetical protein
MLFLLRVNAPLSGLDRKVCGHRADGTCCYGLELLPWEWKKLCGHPAAIAAHDELAE